MLDFNKIPGVIFCVQFCKAAESLKENKHFHIGPEITVQTSDRKLSFQELTNLFSNQVVNRESEYSLNQLDTLIHSFESITEHFKEKEPSLYTRFIYWIRGTSKQELLQKANAELENLRTICEQSKEKRFTKHLSLKTEHNIKKQMRDLVSNLGGSDRIKTDSQRSGPFKVLTNQIIERYAKDKGEDRDAICKLINSVVDWSLSNIYR